MRTAAIAVACLVLAGCGGSGVAGKVKTACMKDSDMTESECSCVADRAAKDLSKDAQAMLVAQMEDNTARVQELSTPRSTVPCPSRVRQGLGRVGAQRPRR
jgi:hypothetical protein